MTHRTSNPANVGSSPTGAKKENYVNQDEQEELIQKVCRSIEQTLIEKNRRYGSSTRTPINVFSAASPIEGIKQRLDDKLKRIKTHTDTGLEPNKNDIFDLIGYLTLYCVEMQWDDLSDLLD